MGILLNAAITFLKGCYWLMKRFTKSQKKVLFISRQSNDLPLDFRLLSDELKRQDPTIRLSSITKRYSGPKGALGFVCAILFSLYHLATSQVCVLDSYWPTVSLLTHKKNLYIIQLWHSIGKVKKSGLQAIGKPGGRPSRLSKQLRMHQKYDAVVAGGSAWNPFYCASFGIGEEKILNLGLPRIDYLLTQAEETRERIYRLYPDLQDKKIILYAPTFRRNGNDGWKDFLIKADYNSHTLIIKSHPNQELSFNLEEPLLCPEFTALELLTVAHYLVTDYSAIALEAAALNVKTYYYVYDYDEYQQSNGLNIDLLSVMQGCVFKSSEDLWNRLAIDNYPQECLDSYRNAYLPYDLGCSTQRIAEIILNRIHDKKE